MSFYTRLVPPMKQDMLPILYYMIVFLFYLLYYNPNPSPFDSMFHLCLFLNADCDLGILPL